MRELEEREDGEGVRHRGPVGRVQADVLGREEPHGEEPPEQVEDGAGRGGPPRRRAGDDLVEAAVLVARGDVAPDAARQRAPEDAVVDDLVYDSHQGHDLDEEKAFTVRTTRLLVYDSHQGHDLAEEKAFALD